MTDRVKRLWHINYVANEHFSCYKQRCTGNYMCRTNLLRRNSPLSRWFLKKLSRSFSHMSFTKFPALRPSPSLYWFPSLTILESSSFPSLESSLASISWQSSEDCCCGNSILVCLYSFLNFFAIEVGDCYLAEGDLLWGDKYWIG